MLLSVSVRDGENEVEVSSNIFTDLLLVSEIKGYVHKPAYYFESDDKEHSIALDQLLMVQGWRRYDIKRAVSQSFDVKYFPEQGIELQGKVISLVKEKPKPNVQLSSFMVKSGQEDSETYKQPNCSLYETDSLGRFSVSYNNIYGKWNLIMSVSENGKKKDHRIIFDRNFSPKPQGYRLVDMQISTVVTEKNDDNSLGDTSNEEEFDMKEYLSALNNSLIKDADIRKVIDAEEVVVKSKKRSQASDIYKNKATSVAYYDTLTVIDEIKDSGKYIGDNIHALLESTNPNFSTFINNGREFFRYKGKIVLFVIDYNVVEWEEFSYFRYKNYRLEAIKSMCINESFAARRDYVSCSAMSSSQIAENIGCVVFLETYPDKEIQAEAGKGVRKTVIEGYSTPKEFYQPDYAVLPKIDDYRRTLYWNPALEIGSDGKTKVNFYNNGKVTKLKINVEGITEDGTIINN